MIRLEVEEICETCPNFEAVSSTSTLYAENEPVHTEHVVTCRNSEVCRNIRAFMETVLAERDKEKASDA